MPNPYLSSGWSLPFLCIWHLCQGLLWSWDNQVGTLPYVNVPNGCSHLSYDENSLWGASISCELRPFESASFEVLLGTFTPDSEGEPIYHGINHMSAFLVHLAVDNVSCISFVSHCDTLFQHFIGWHTLKIEKAGKSRRKPAIFDWTNFHPCQHKYNLVTLALQIQVFQLEVREAGRKTAMS